jgi:8-oxo-dGTP pyrophosphatase MutT (NUDIX family)
MPTATQPSKDAAKEFLLAEYARFAEAFWRNETTGETRVNWFIGIVTAGLTGLVALVTKTEAGSPAGDHLQAIVLAGLAALLVFGIVTFARMITRNERTDQYKYAIDSIRQSFQDNFDQTGTVLKNPVGERSPEDPPKRKLGGLTHIVAAINSIVIAAIVGVGLYPTYSHKVADKTLFLIATAVLALILLCFSFWLQYWYAKRRNEEAHERFWGKDPRHAGGVVFELTADGTVNYLVIHPYGDQTPQEKKDKAAKEIDTSKWVLPKGKIDPGESQPQAALREVLEESGVCARIVSPLGTVEYDVKANEHVKTKFYLMEKISEQATQEVGRTPTWLKFDDALGDLSHDGSKKMLTRAELVRKQMKAVGSK